MDKMMSIAEEQGIVVYYHNFSNFIKGIYWFESNMPPIIGLDKSLRTSPPLLRCVLAEELGHYFTSYGPQVAHEFCNYSARTAISKMEYKALYWAANYLIPENDLLDVVCSGLYEPWEIAEHFNVTEEFAKLRLRIFGARSNH